MRWNDHSKQVKEGDHAFLGASKYSWINWSEDKLIENYIAEDARKRGTELHEFACKCIKLKQKLPKSNKTLNMYVNDAIGFNMMPEQVLYFSDNCFGTADAIAFNEKKSFLRIHDLKTGLKVPAKLTQLEVYAALFCLEYDIKPSDIEMELRIYQFDDVLIGQPTVEVIAPIMDKIIIFDKLIESIREGE